MDLDLRTRQLGMALSFGYGTFLFGWRVWVSQRVSTRHGSYLRLQNVHVWLTCMGFSAFVDKPWLLALAMERYCLAGMCGFLGVC